jgi:DNA replication and repair protein RecF
MPIDYIAISNFRNLSNVVISPSPSINIITGDNGAGKTSLLEAIFYLSRGKSFRSHITKRIIQKNQPSFIVRAEVNEDRQQIKLGIQRFADGKTLIHLNHENQKSIAALTNHLPIKLIRADSYRYFFDGPKLRRQHLDWGVFHVEPTYFRLWQQAQHVLKQRNACLKKNTDTKQITFWDQQLTKASEEMHSLRLSYIKQLIPTFNKLSQHILPKTPIQMCYKKGWPEGTALKTALDQSLIKDKQFGYTSCGPHRADLQLYHEKTPAADVLSQGEQKLISYVISLSQCILLKKLTKKIPIILIDDLASELDLAKYRLILDIIRDIDAQIFITNITHNASAHETNKETVFHVEQGNII